MTQLTDSQKWESLLRGQVMSATTLKLNNLIRMVDQKAQTMILLNTVLIPFCMQAYEAGYFARASAVCIITAILSIFSAIVCIYPKRKYRKNKDRDLNLLHFNDIGHLEKQEYLDLFLPEFNDPSRLAKMVVSDIYDTSRNSIMPKFVWLKVSYGIFFFGNLIAIACAFASM